MSRIDMLALMDAMLHVPTDAMATRINALDLPTRSRLAVVADLALVDHGGRDPARDARHLAALTASLALTVAVDLSNHRFHSNMVSVRRRDQPLRICHWSLLGLCGRSTSAPPHLAGVDAAWLDRVTVAHAAEPWLLRLLAARAAAIGPRP